MRFHKDKKVLLLCQISVIQLLASGSLVWEEVLPWLENVALWHTHSSVERIVLPDSFCLVDDMLKKFTDIVDKLWVYTETMQANIDTIMDRVGVSIVKK